MTLAELVTDLHSVEQHIHDLVVKHEPAIDAAAAKLAKLEASPIVQALETAAGIPPALEQSIASLIGAFVTHAQTLPSPAAGTPDAGVPAEDPTTPAGPDAEPDPQPAAA